MAKDNFSNSDTTHVEHHPEATGTYSEMALRFLGFVGGAVVSNAFIGGVSATSSPSPSH